MSIPSERAKTPPGGVSVVPEIVQSSSSTEGISVVPQRAKSPSPKGMGSGSSTLQPVETSTLKRSSDDFPPPKVPKIGAPQCVPETKPTVPPLPNMSDEKKQTSREIYSTLATGALSKFLQLDPTKWGFTGHLVVCGGLHGISLISEVGSVQQKSATVQDVHPLSFLLFVSQEKDMQTHLCKLREMGGTWDSHVDKLRQWLPIEKLPWAETIEKIGKNIEKHQEKGTLQLDSFLAAMPEDKRAALTRRINEKRYSDLCEGIIGLK